MLKHSKYRNLIILFFLIGLFLQLLVSFSYWVGGDQMHLLELGMRLVDGGNLSSFSKLKEGGGANLGSLMQILVAGPLFIWENFRAPMLVPILFNIGAYLMISKIIFENYQDKGLLIFTIIFWLSPIRLYNTGFLWEPAYILLPAAMHLYSAYYMRSKKSAYLTFMHIFSLFVGLQIHNSVLILVIASLYLLFSRKVKVEWKGFALGLFTGLLFFIPLILDVLNNNLPESTSSSGYLGQSLLKVAPFLKGVLYFVKMTTFDMVKAIQETSFWDGSYRWIMYIFQILSISVVVFGVYANYKYYRGSIFKKWANDYQSFSPTNLWLKDYGVSIFWGLIISAALSPITLQAWMVLIIIFGAILPLQHLLSSFSFNEQKPKLFMLAFVIIELIMVFTFYFGQLKFNRPEQYPKELQEQKYENLERLFE